MVQANRGISPAGSQACGRLQYNNDFSAQVSVSFPLSKLVCAGGADSTSRGFTCAPFCAEVSYSAMIQMECQSETRQAD